MEAADPIYCCDNPGCPGGEACTTRDGAAATCEVSETCGNLTIDEGETCDGDCQTSCDDLVACTRNVLTGSAETCDAACSYPAITTCGPADGCCPGCAPGADPDCSDTCGNGVIDEGESCDGDCPTSCEDEDPCTEDMLVGSAEDCTAECSHAPITTCADGDGCCAPGCTGATDAECPAAGVIGAACTSDADCGPGGGCITNWQGGYCSRLCETDAECGASAHCHAFEGVCVANCARSSHCRAPEYGCFDHESDGRDECWPLGTGSGSVGGPCGDVGDCAGGTRGMCLVNDLHDGYCTLRCSSALTCPAGSHCAFDGEGSGFCLVDCATSADCRSTGYACYDAEGSGGDTECWAAATGAGDIGDPCEDFWDCGGGTSGWCARELTDGTPLPGGYCTRSCFPLPIDDCPTGSHCSGALTSDAFCVSDCAAAAECRSGYTCLDAFSSPFDPAPALECWLP